MAYIKLMKDARKVISKVRSRAGYRYTLSCLFCGNNFEIPGSIYNRGQGKFCSSKCYTNNNRGSNNPAWIGGLPKCKICGIKLSNHKSKICIKCYSNNRFLKDNPNWKGTKNNRGYNQVKCKHKNSNQQGYIMEHRYVAEKALGRLLKRSEVIHHIDGNKRNNDYKNLYLFKNHSKHMIYHQNLKYKRAKLITKSNLPKRDK